MRVSIKLKNYTVEVGDGLPTHLISEIGLNHNGSVDLAKEMILQSALSGATMVKFQKRFPAKLAVREFLNQEFPKAPVFGSTQREVRENLELSFEEYRILKEYAESLGLIFFATAFDLDSLQFLIDLKVPLLKIASHSVTNGELLDAIAETGLPVIVSFGATTTQERDYAVKKLKNNPLIIMHCVSSYPTPDDIVNVDTIPYYKERFKVPIGFSSHETGIDISVAASLFGACIIERHFTLNRAMIGLDHGISLEPKEFAEMALKIARLSKIRGVSKDLNSNELPTKNKYHVAICSTRELLPGHKIIRKDLVCKQPLLSSEKYFTGTQMDDVIGKTVIKKIANDVQIPKAFVK